VTFATSPCSGCAVGRICCGESFAKAQMHACLPKLSCELFKWLFLSATHVTATITATDKGTFR
jgi:hypothetical protein